MPSKSPQPGHRHRLTTSVHTASHHTLPTTRFSASSAMASISTTRRKRRTWLWWGLAVTAGLVVVHRQITSKSSPLLYDPHLGLAYVPPSISTLSTHPLEILIAEAEKRHADLQAKMDSVKTLEDAVRDYKEMWGMDPPRGFDRWFAHALSTSSNHVPSLIPSSHAPIRNFLSMSPKTLHRRVKMESGNKDFAYSVFLYRNETLGKAGKGEGVEGCAINVTKPAGEQHGNSWAPPLVRALMEPVAHIIPPPLPGDDDTHFIFSVEDAPRRLVGYEVMARAQELTDKGELWDEKELEEYERKYSYKLGWRYSCPPDSPFRNANVQNDNKEADMKVEYPVRADWNLDRPKSWIHDPWKYADFCENLDYGQMHSTLLSDNWRASTALIPVVVQARVATSSDIPWSPTMATAFTHEYMPWSSKVNQKLLWRGTPTGMVHGEDTAWRAMQRHRINYLAHNATGSRDVLVKQPSGGLLSTLSSSSYALETYDIKDLVDAYVDVGLVDGPYFCRKEDGSCDIQATQVAWVPRMSEEDAKNYKYILDLDGHSWSQRFRRELSAGGVVFKSTIHPEWHSSMLIPWYHYVPLKVDYSDLFDTLSFFRGSPDGKYAGRDDLAQKIAERGRAFAIENWRTEDMQSFTLLMMLEYQRLWSNDRKAASFVL